MSTDNDDDDDDDDDDMGSVFSKNSHKVSNPPECSCAYGGKPVAKIPLQCG